MLEPWPHSNRRAAFVSLEKSVVAINVTIFQSEVSEETKGSGDKNSQKMLETQFCPQKGGTVLSGHRRLLSEQPLT